MNALDTLYKQEIQTPHINQIQQDLVPDFSVKQSPKFSETFEDEIIPSVYAATWHDGFKQKDLRPRLKDGEVTYLLDTGSMCCVWPAGPDDVLDQDVHLQTVDGSPFDCYGTKTIHLKMGRKQYSIPAVIAKVKSPILGFDFVDKYKLDTVWGEFGDLAKLTR